jgi:ATP-dependent DNA helicase RecQ
VDLELKILEKYWGYKQFRPLQRDIITSALEGRDTLAILPTGGGKSVCFQIPALMKEGLCLVVSPLIALMKDQVENLRKRGINAIAVYSGMTAREVDIAFDNAVYGNYKFLYLSPERLKSEIFRIRASKMNISFVVVDEAHCISQWGYDFRPEYLRINEIYEITGRKPVLAFTATATPYVKSDIADKLDLKNPRIITGSFERPNLSYIARKTENKHSVLLKLATSSSGSGIVYVRERKKAEEIASFLVSQGFVAEAYHAGLSSEVRSKKQEDWMRGNVSIIVATNAFGMGIDKENVRFVCHFDLTESLEAYYQEAGRAGRDGERSFAVMLWNESDVRRLENISRMTFPDQAYLSTVYQKLYKFFDIAYGEGKESVHRFNLENFSKKLKLHALSAYYAIKYLQSDGFLTLTEELNIPTRITFLVTREELYIIQLKQENLDAFIKLLLRLYPGVFSGYVAINENVLARLSRNSKAAIFSMLTRLSRMGVVGYFPGARSPLMIFHRERLEERAFRLDTVDYKKKKEAFDKRVGSVLSYVSLDSGCRSGFLAEYFGQKQWTDCGNCDLCLKRKHISSKRLYEKETENRIRLILKDKPVAISDLQSYLDDYSGDYLKVIREMAERGDIIVKGDVVILR